MFLNNLNDQNQQGQNQGQQGQGQSQPNQGQTIEELRAQLTAVTKNAKNEALAQLLMDPDFAAVARAKHEGRSIKIIPLGQGQQGNQGLGDGNGRQELPTPTKPIEEMTESEKIQYMISEVAKALKPNLNEVIKPLQQQTERLNTIVTENEGEKIRLRIARLKQENPDFDDYREEMVKLIDQHPTLPVEHVFTLAKASSGRLVDKRQINQSMSSFASSERPTTVAERPGNPAGYDSSTNGIRSTVSDTVRELLTSSFGSGQNRGSFDQGLRV